MAAMVAADAGEAALEVAAVEKLGHDLRDDGAEGSVAGLISERVKLKELVKMAVHALPEGRLLRISGAIGLHTIVGQYKRQVCHLTAHRREE
jgi:hypothetical protein